MKLICCKSIISQTCKHTGTYIFVFSGIHTYIDMIAQRMREVTWNYTIVRNLCYVQNDIILIQYVCIKLRIGIYKPDGNTKTQDEELQQKNPPTTVRGDKT